MNRFVNLAILSVLADFPVLQRAVIDRLNAEAKRALESPEVRERPQAIGSEPTPTTSQELERIIGWEIRDNIDLAKKAAIRLQ